MFELALVTSGTLISPSYVAMCRHLHANATYGRTGGHVADPVKTVAAALGTRDILDYGCGKCALQAALGFAIHNYDPCVPAHQARPAPADIVVCTEVLEHIEPACLDAVLDDIATLTRLVLIASVSTHPANSILPDGRNAHLIQQPAAWWLPQLQRRFARVLIGPTSRGPKGFAVEAWR